MRARHARLLLASLLRREDGQDLAEYVLLVGLIAVLAIVVVAGLGAVLGVRYNAIANQLLAAL